MASDKIQGYLRDTTTGALLISGADPVDALASGESTLSRLLAGGTMTMTSQTLRLTLFTARKTEVITKAKWFASTTAAGATPTLVRYGIYTEDADGGLTLVASTVNDTAIFAAPNTGYQKTLSASFTKTAGLRYACGVLVVTAATAPTVNGITSVPALLTAGSPRLAVTLTGQADLPSSVAAATVAANAGATMGYCELAP